MSISSLFQFLIGFVLGIILFGAGIAGGAYFFLTNVGGNPPKPTFEDKTAEGEKQQNTNANGKKVTESKKANTATVANENNSPKETPQLAAEGKKTEEKKTSTEQLPAGAYRARVIWSSGLSLRAEPTQDSERIGGVAYNTELIVLGVSEDGRWQRVRIPGSNQEGWVKAGNIEKITESSP
ncbi:MAG: SH3 domain-containing protein [Geminocystis sp.]|nr:SH3 domain-containing protein [Geminocystis sp.]HIK37598.1 SH3 domain-containing protein [Geminocystis sp. M7585_C2015_104]MCS7146599.1 SH3 domain-containing protein [Geminocystis sp.]MCX8077502.1 SH3 domain-containing protein [Geminocystis sp.]MDW8115425.1 SH3 domain-containing protein [Geminocystis sp.]